MSLRAPSDVLDLAPASAADVIIALGSNLGDRGQTITLALRDLSALEGVALRGQSPLYESVAITMSGPDPEAPPYLNGVALISTTLSPRALLRALQRIEAAHGRVREIRWGARTLDLDIVDFAGITSGDPDLTLPHPRAAERSFVLVPWLDVDPHAVLPGRGAVAALPAASESLLEVAS